MECSPTGSFTFTNKAEKYTRDCVLRLFLPFNRPNSPLHASSRCAARYDCKSSVRSYGLLGLLLDMLFSLPLIRLIGFRALPLVRTGSISPSFQASDLKLDVVQKRVAPTSYDATTEGDCYCVEYQCSAI